MRFFNTTLLGEVIAPSNLGIYYDTSTISAVAVNAVANGTY